MHRFYSPKNNYSAQINITDPSEIHHLRDVLRLKENDTIEVFNGKGEQALGSIICLDKRSCLISINKVIKSKKNNLTLILACAIPKKSKFETIIEKATELGVDEVIPLITKRTEIVLKGERLTKKHTRFQSIALNAAKQCKRTDIPIIHLPVDYKRALDQMSAYTTIVMPSLTKNAKNLLNSLPKKRKEMRLSVFIGPEGDFTKEEYQLAHKKGAIHVSLGETVLKVDTAALSAVSGIKLFYSS